MNDVARSAADPTLVEEAVPLVQESLRQLKAAHKQDDAAGLVLALRTFYDRHRIAVSLGQRTADASPLGKRERVVRAILLLEPRAQRLVLSCNAGTKVLEADINAAILEYMVPVLFAEIFSLET